MALPANGQVSVIDVVLLALALKVSQRNAMAATWVPSGCSGLADN
jgi:hypothetical protein